jgi:hypothetical protein
MSTLGSAPKKVLPFKRTAKRKPVQPSESKPKSKEEEEDALELFNRRPAGYFEEEERRASEKINKREKKRRESLVNEDEDVKAQIQRESEYNKTLFSPKKKRARSASHDGEDIIQFSPRPSSRKSSSSRITAKSPSQSRGDMSFKTTPPSSHPGLRSRKPAQPTETIVLDDSDDSDFEQSHPVGKATQQMRDEMANIERFRQGDDSDSDLVEIDGLEPVVEEEWAAKYVAEMRARMEQNKIERLGREDSSSDEPVELLIESRLEGIPVVNVKLKLIQKLKIVKETWVRKHERDERVSVPTSVLENMFFTWRGNKIYDLTTLESLGIKPPSSRDGVSSPWEGSREGFKGSDKIHIEVWTQELFDQHQAELDRERKRKRGELDEEMVESEPEPEPAKDERIRVVLRSKDHGEQRLKVPPNCEVSHLVKAFRKQKNIPEEMRIEVQFDGEVLQEDSTIDEFDIGDMETVDVYIR